MSADGDSRRRSAIVILFLLALPPVLLSIDTGLALLRVWRPQISVDRFVTGTIAVWSCGVVSIGALPPTRRWLLRFGPRLLACEFSACLAWLAVDATLWIARERPGFHLRPAGLRAVIVADPEILPGIRSPGYFTLNSQGIRGPEMPERAAAFRILCIGGSTTECGYLDDERTWPSLLMQKLNESRPTRPVWAGNVGTSGFAMSDHVRFIRESGLVRDVDCLIVTAGFNDLHWGLVGGERPAPPIGPLWSRSPLLERLRAAWSHAYPIEFEDRTGATYKLRRERRRKMQVVRELPDLSGALDGFERGIVEATESARSAGVRILFVTQPVLWSSTTSARAESLFWMGWIDAEHCLAPDVLSQAMARFNERLRSTCAKLGVDCLSVDELGGREELFYDDCHFTDRGAVEVSDRIAAWFVEHRERVGW